MFNHGKQAMVLGVILAAVHMAGAVARAAQVPGTAIGVNVINPYALSIAEQEQLLSAIHDAGVPVIRASITLDERGVAFADRAFKHDIRIEWLIYHFGGSDPFGKTPLSAADPAQFRKTFRPILDDLEAKGIVLAGFELGNEINLSGTNPEFLPPHGRARQLSLADLRSDPQGQKIASGYLQYLKILAVLKDMRDHSKLNQHSPIMTAGLGTYDQDDGPLPGWSKGDIVGINTTLRFMRMHGLDDLVDAYAVHIYPDTKHASADASALRKDRIARYDLAACRAQGSSEGKPCWITEWGIDNDDLGCPVNDAARAQMVREIAGDFRPYVQQGKVAGLLYFAWNSTPKAGTVMASSLWRCGQLTAAGKLAIDADLLK